MTPLSAVATAVAGLHKYTWSLGVPLRPGKLRLKVRTDTAPEGGAWPMPTHGPQAGSSMRAPARTRSRRTPVVAIVSRICREPGVTVTTSVGEIVLPASTAAGRARSAYPELTDEPKH